MGSAVGPGQNQIPQLSPEDYAAIQDLIGGTNVGANAGAGAGTEQTAPTSAANIDFYGGQRVGAGLPGAIEGAVNQPVQGDTYSNMAGLIESLGDDAQIGLQVPVVNPIAEDFQNYILTQLKDTATRLPFFTPETASSVAGLSPGQLAAIDNAMGGIGGYEPFINLAESYYSDAGAAADMMTPLVGSATGLGGQATGIATGGSDVAFGKIGDVDRRVSQLEAGGARSYDPNDVSRFMNPFEDEVVQRALSDIQTESDKARQQRRAEAAAAGAFGGSRAGAVEAQLDRATLEQQAQTAAELRRAGFESASERAQKAFEDQQNRFLAANQLGLGSLIDAGQLGLGAGELGLKGITTGLAGTELGANILSDQSGLLRGLGDAQSDLAARISGLSALDTETLLNIGGLQQDQDQRLKDAIYADKLATIRDPYTQLQILSDIFNQVPYSQSALSVSSAPGGAPAANRGGVLTGGGLAAVGYGLDALRRG